MNEAEDQIMKLRLDEDPDSFPPEDMMGEVRKEGPEVYCYVPPQATWVDKWYVAAKRFRGREWALSEKEERRFKRQVNIWRTLNHPNILRLLGVCEFDKNRPPYLISQWMKYGNVKQYLKKFPEAD
ncbi:hypothetical protein M407DRAFT_23616 [Tulasnella calospora MUT 4182]|uniref:Protein kinase domain-containing protein n=1 Tax=Tulasnella calospora MUT 4182 TaxID=1051891 RepID=A0A0C3L073_9AGAM|nr:hypothetical protein M407DRAFT_23616 [Tulasnella calospora MUT 4182]